MPGEAGKEEVLDREHYIGYGFKKDVCLKRNSIYKPVVKIVKGKLGMHRKKDVHMCVHTCLIASYLLLPNALPLRTYYANVASWTISIIEGEGLNNLLIFFTGQQAPLQFFSTFISWR